MLQPVCATKGASEYATNGVAESVMHEVKRKTRVLKFALEAHLIFAVRECCEQMHRGDHFIFEHSSIASSWNEPCV